MNKNYPHAYIDYLVHFHGDRDYFECHEILEHYWKEHTRMDRDSIWVGWIQLAVALYHYRRNNLTGALRTVEKAIPKFRLHEQDLPEFGINKKLFLDRMQSLQAAIKSNTPYSSIHLPIEDEALEHICIEKCTDKGFGWRTCSDLSNEMIVERHRLRDRQDIIALRQQELKKRQQKSH
ncbi:DUF309 domain-containing protein [Jeotgalibacillus marinus]|uniref:DUF309 domain-containing protein n=1 Tax=Jeotgalibacillus marinus TaxID=86667 RepID=A0ABV3PZJ4_9BACL